MVKRAPTLLLLGLITFGGFCLRLYRAGYYSFWNDEAGQLLAGLQPTLSDTLYFVRSHAMAMPLDYFVTRLLSRVTLSEAALRLPSIVWGTLIILIIFFLSRELFGSGSTGTKVGLFSAFLVALSPIHIVISQEMRFYAALAFFYWLLTLLIFLFLRRPSIWLWAALTGAFLIGIFFHPYTLLVLANGFWLLLFANKMGLPVSKAGKPPLLGKTAILLGVTGLIGTIAFGLWLIIIQPNNQFNYSPLQFYQSAFELFFHSMGWKAINFCPGRTVFGPWEIFSISATVVGLGLLLFQRPVPWSLIALVLGLFTQVGIIIVLVAMRGYWLVYRQFLHLTPLIFIIMSFGIVEILNRLSARFDPAGSLRAVRSGITVGVCLLIFLFAVPRLIDYYNMGKSNAREVVEAVLAEGNPQSTLLIMPGYEQKIYQVYFYSMYQNNSVKLKPVDVSSLEKNETPGERNYVVFPSIPGNEADLISALGYRPILVPDLICVGTRSVYGKDP